MAKDNYFKLIYMILTVLYRYKKINKKLDVNEIAAETLQIEEVYRDEVLQDLLDDGYIKGFEIKTYICGKAIMNLENATITMKGVEYLKNNSMMKQVAILLKDVKDWIRF